MALFNGLRALVALIAVVCIVAVSVIGSNASSKFSLVGSAVR